MSLTAITFMSNKPHTPKKGGYAKFRPKNATPEDDETKNAETFGGMILGMVTGQGV